MGKVLLLMLVMLMKTVMGRTYSVPRVQMIQRQSCYYTPYDKQLTCQCTNSETNTFLKLKLMFFIKEKGQEVRSVLIQSCEDLMVGLDLTGVNPKDIPVKFKNCGSVSFSYINFDRQFSGGQLLRFNMETVNKVKLEGLDVKDALQINTNRVKELILHQNRFTHIPLPGLEIVHADKLVITDNYFHRISPGSIIVKSAKEVEVINNQFSINAIQVVRSSEGSRLYISCNRLLGEKLSPECVTTTTTTTAAPPPPSTTTFSTTSSTTVRMTTVSGSRTGLENVQNEVKTDSENMFSMELLIGLVVGVAVLVLVLLIVVIILCCKRKKAKTNAVSKVKEDPDKQEILVDKVEDNDSGNNSSDSLPVEAERLSLLQSEEVNHVIEASKPKFSSPVWLDEIQQNKIFNKQKSINLEDETPKRPKTSFPVRSISEIIDSESDNEDTDNKTVTDSSFPAKPSNNNVQSKPTENSDKSLAEKRVTRETDL